LGWLPGPLKKVQRPDVWEGVVHIFDLDNNSRATRAYAESSPMPKSRKRGFLAIPAFGRKRRPEMPPGGYCGGHRTERKIGSPMSIRVCDLIVLKGYWRLFTSP